MPRMSAASGPSYWRSYLRLNVKARDHLANVFLRIGSLAARRPLALIFACVLISGLCGLGYMNKYTEDRMDKLWVPQNSKAVKDLHFVQDHWGGIPGLEQLVITGKNEGDNVFTREALSEVWDIHEAVMDANHVEDGEIIGIDTICMKIGDWCDMVNVLGYWHFNRTLFEEESMAQVQARVSAPAVYPWGLKINRTSVMGGITYTEQGKVVQTAEAYHIQYYVVQNDTIRPLSFKWEENVFLPLVTREFKHIQLYRSAERSISDEVARSVQGNTLLYGICYVTMVVYTALALGKFTRVQSKALLSVAGVLTICCGILIGYGFGSLGAFQSKLLSVLPFLMVGIGVDNIFILNGFLRDQPKHLSVEDRISRGLSKAGITMCFAMLINVFAFGMGITSSLPGVSNFCVFAAITVAAVVLLECTMFVAFLALDERRIEQGRMDILPCIVVPSAVVRRDAAHGGGVTKRTPLNAEAAGLSVTLDHAAAADDDDDDDGHGGGDPSKRSAVRRFMEDKYAPFLLHPVTKVTVVVFFTVLVGVGAYGAANVGLKFAPQELLPDGSYVGDFIDQENKYFDNGAFLEIILLDYDYTTIDAQAALAKLRTELVKSKWIQGGVTSWYFFLQEFVHLAHPSHIVHDGLIAPEHFYADLRELLATQPALNANLRWKADGTLFSSRLTTSHIPLKLGPTSVDAMQDTRDLVSDAGGGLRGFPFQYLYVFYEQNLTTWPETMDTMVFSSIAVMVVATFFLYHPGAALIVTVNIVMIDVCLLGWMYFIGVNLNAVSMVEVILSVGLAVDWLVHIAFLFMISPGTRDERVLHSLGVVGSAILSGGFSTFLAVMVLVFSISQVFRVFFRMMTGIILLSVLHGMVFLPVVLSYVGPAHVSAKSLRREESPLASPTSSSYKRFEDDGQPAL